MLRKTQARGATRSSSCKGSGVKLKDFEDVAQAADMPALESRLVRFANDLGFGIISGALVVEHGASRISTFHFGNTPEAFQSTSHETELRKRDPVMRRLKRLSAPFV